LARGLLSELGGSAPNLRTNNIANLPHLTTIQPHS